MFSPVERNFQLEPVAGKLPLVESFFYSEKLFVASYLLLLRTPCLPVWEWRVFQRFLTSSPLKGTFVRASTHRFLAPMMKLHPITSVRMLYCLHMVLSEIELNVPLSVQDILYKELMSWI